MSMQPPRGPGAAPLLLGLTAGWAAVGLLLAVAAPAALAEEIVYRDPDTCEEQVVRASEITSETWTEIQYRERARGPEKKIPTALVVRIERAGTRPEQKELRAAMGEIARGNLAEARRQLKVLSGGGYKQDLESGQLRYQSFAANDQKRRRPPWTSEYAHFFYAKALYLEGVEKSDRELLERAHLALVDQKVPGGDGKETTGGFLQRFEGGNSRWYPEAMLLTAQTLVALGRYDEAAKAYKALSDAAIAVEVGPRWAYEAKLGPGRIAEAGTKHNDAINAYVDAANSMRLLLPKATQNCVRQSIGRFFSRARMEAARVMLQQAEANRSPPEFQRLRKFIEESTPEALERQLQSMPKTQRDALVEGALDPGVQAVMQNGLGLAYLHDKRFEEALLAFREVEVKYFQVPEEHARALHYLAEAAAAAAGETKEQEARRLYSSYAEEARRRLKEEHPNSRWAK